MTHCDECGARFIPLDDSYRCPVCGTENYPDEDEDAVVEPRTSEN
jgi:uncharacterized Zn finger protein (UPF0148 family)